MRGKSLALLVLALGCGLVASLGITQLMAKRADTAAESDLQSVYVAVKDIRLGGVLNKESIKLEEWPKDKIPPGALSRAEDVEGRRAKGRFYVGEPILEQKLFGRGANEQNADALIPKGYRVVSVKVDPVTIHGGLLLPGSRVDIQVHILKNCAAGFPETMTKTILEDIKVFAVNDVTNLDAQGQGPDTKSIQGRTVSLLVTPEQAETVTLASEMGTVRLVMRGPDDDTKSNSNGTKSRKLLGGTDAGDRGNETLVKEGESEKDAKKGFLDYLNKFRTQAVAAAKTVPPAQAEPQPEPARWSMRLLKGAELNDVNLEGDPSLADKSDGGTWKIHGQNLTSATKPSANAKADVNPVAPPEPPKPPKPAEPKAVDGDAAEPPSDAEPPSPSAKKLQDAAKKAKIIKELLQ